MADFPGIDAPSATKALTPPPAPPAAPDKPAQTGVAEKMISSFGSGVKEAVRENKALDAQSMKMSPPKLDLPPKPEFKNTDPIEAWGSMAMVFAALASFKVRNHASTAMNAAASALKGIQQQDKDSFERAYKTWEMESKNAIDLANFQQRAYDELLRHTEHQETLNMEAGKALDAAQEAKLKTLTIALQDPGMWKAYEENGLAGAADFDKTRQRQKEDFELRKVGMTAAGQKAQQTFALRDAVASPEFKAAKTTSEKLEVLAAHGVDSEHILLAIAKLDQTADIASDKMKAGEDRATEKAREFDQTYGLKARGADEKAREFDTTTGLKKDTLEEKKSEFGVTENRKEGEDAFKGLEHADKMKAEQAKIDEKAKESDEKLKFYKDKLKADTEAKHAAVEEKAKEAFDKIALGKDTLEERAINDNAKLNLNKYKIGESHEEFEERMKLQKDKSALDAKRDDERKAEFREKMDLELKKFDEKSAVDADRIGVAKERLTMAEKATGGRGGAPMAPEEIEETAQEMAHLKIPMASDFLAARNKSWGQANRRAIEIAKSEGKDNFSAQWYPTLQAQRKDAASGQASKGIRYLSVANKHLEAMEAAVMALPNDSDLKGLTRVFNFVSNQVNDSNLAAEQVDGQIVANEVAKAISGAGNLTGDERHELNSMFDAARGKASILNIIHHARELLGGQAGGYVKQFSHYGDAADVTGMDPEAAKSFFINPKTGETDESLVKWDRARIAATLSGQKPPPMPGAAPAAGGWKFEPTQMFNGKPVGEKDGKWVYEDGSLVEGQ